MLAELIAGPVNTYDSGRESYPVTWRPVSHRRGISDSGFNPRCPNNRQNGRLSVSLICSGRHPASLVLRPRGGEPRSGRRARDRPSSSSLSARRRLSPPPGSSSLATSPKSWGERPAEPSRAKAWDRGVKEIESYCQEHVSPTSGALGAVSLIQSPSRRRARPRRGGCERPSYVLVGSISSPRRGSSRGASNGASASSAEAPTRAIVAPRSRRSTPVGVGRGAPFDRHFARCWAGAGRSGRMVTVGSAYIYAASLCPPAA
jgi:hypothetical protein